MTPFGTDTLELGSSPLELLLCDESLQKPLLEVYKELFVERPEMLSNCRDTGSSLIPDFQGDG